MTVPTAVVIAVLGLGEAGSEVAADLVAAGATVHGFDPRVAAAPAGVLTFGSDAEAARGAAVVIALTSAHEAIETLELALPGVGPGAVYADLNTGSASLKSALAAIAEPAGVAFTDIALMAPVPGLGLRTPMLASGPAAPEYAATFGALGATVTVLPKAGTAATRKLVRSVFYKGLAAAVTEALRAGRAAGCEEWLRADIGRVLADASAATVDRLEEGSIRHARRRIDEMAAAARLLDELGVPPRVSRASQAWLEQLLDEQAL